ncbi:hypothetical protein RKD37_007025 [Streptomyces ambofaciens]
MVICAHGSEPAVDRASSANDFSQPIDSRIGSVRRLMIS